jgi:glucan phosphoethanolaminetransferase (alkaline phosphatase superfamily)
MVSFKEFTKPGGLKIVLSIALLLPVSALLFFFFAFISVPLRRIVPIDRVLFLTLIVGIIVVAVTSYLVGCLFDTFIKSRTVKIVIVAVMSLLSIIIGYFIYRFFSIQTMICDPVHTPSDCEIGCRQIIESAINKSDQIIQQKFYDCMSNCYK